MRFVSDYALCNFKCPYCIVSKFQAKYKEDREWHEENYKVIVDHLSLLPFPINVRFGVRGEFFLQKTLVGGARFLSQADNCAGVNLISNLSFRSNQYDQVLDGFDLDKVAMVASFHPTEIKDVPAWVETARYLNSRIDFSVVLVAYPPLITQLSESVTMLRDAGLQVAVQAFVGTLEGRRYPQSYSDEEKEIIRHVMYSRHDYEHWINLKMPGFV